jgi:uncharacterized protein
MDRWNTQPRYAYAAPDEQVVASFMAGVYRWMAAGLAVTGAVGLALASNPALLIKVVSNPILMIALLVAQVGLAIGLTAAIQRASFATLASLFLAYSASMGVTMGVVLLVYTGASVGTVFFTTGGTFLAMSAYGTLTKKSLDSWGSFLMMGLVGIVIASLVNLFFQSPGLTFVLSCAGVVVFTGLTAWDTQRIRQYAGAGDNRLALFGAFQLYLDFVNLFLALLRLLGNRRSE